MAIVIVFLTLSHLPVQFPIGGHTSLGLRTARNLSPGDILECELGNLCSAQLPAPWHPCALEPLPCSLRVPTQASCGLRTFIKNLLCVRHFAYVIIEFSKPAVEEEWSSPHQRGKWGSWKAWPDPRWGSQSPDSLGLCDPGCFTTPAPTPLLYDTGSAGACAWGQGWPDCHKTAYYDNDGCHFWASGLVFSRCWVFSFYMKRACSDTIWAHYCTSHLASQQYCQINNFTPISQMNKLRHKEIKFIYRLKYMKFMHL